MIDQKIIEHHIQKHIVSVLMYQRYARFRDLRPPKTDTNLFTYHLNVLLRADYVSKTENGYTLSQNGLVYVDRVSSKKFNLRSQPKIITMLLIQNSDGDVLLQKRSKQPYIDSWTLPYGKIHIDDESIAAAAQREAFEKLGLAGQELMHAGDCYIRVKRNSQTLSSTLAHVFTFYRDNISQSDTLQWVKPHKLTMYDLAPAVEQIVARGFFRDPYFFEEFEEV